MAESRALIPVAMYTQTDKLKESKDLSANLVGGDFEGQYKGKQQAGWRQNIFFKIALGVLTVWLLALTVVREVQLSNLRQEVDILTANMIVMSSTVKKISDNRLFNEFQTLEDTIYADEDQDNFANDAKDTGKDRQDDSLEKLHDLTVLEDVNQPEDDEDLFDDTDDDGDEVSGDWYMDYDRRGSKVVTTNMVRLKPEDFTDAVLKQDSVSHIREIKRLLNENPEIDSVSLPTEKPRGTPKETPKETSKEAPKEAPKRERRSFFPEASSEANSGFVVPNAVSKVPERRKNKKYASSRDANMKVHTVSRSARNSGGEEGGYREPFVAAHFHGNTSHLTLGVHEHFKGNGLIRVKHEHDVWFPSPWTLATPHPRPSLIRNRYIHVHHSGVYFVYAQIYYLDSRDVISWVLQRKDPTKGWETLLQCAQSSHSMDSKPNSCFSASALYLKAGDILAVKNTREELHSIMQQEKSFVGLIKLADAEMPDEEI